MGWGPWVALVMASLLLLLTCHSRQLALLMAPEYCALKAQPQLQPCFRTMILPPGSPPIQLSGYTPFPHGPLQALHLCLSVGSMPRILYFSLFGDSMGLAQSRQCQCKVATGIYHPLN